MKRRLKWTVVAQMDGRAIRGVLVGVYRDAYALHHAEYVNPEGPDMPIEGEVVLPREQVRYLTVGRAAGASLQDS